ncbi:MAG: hypothetical protein ACRD1P_04435 [Thermoanaerobaculia bacterium]
MSRRVGARAFVLLFLLALAARLAAAGLGGFGQPRFGDWQNYVAAATHLIRTGHYPDRTEELLFRPPGYPFFLAVATFGHPESIARDKIAGAAAGALAAPLLAALSARLFRRRGIAIATGVAAALNPAFVFIASDVQSEAIFLPLLLGAASLLLASSDRPSTILAAGSGALLAAAALARPSALALSPLLAAPLLDLRWPPRARAHLASAAILGFVLTLAPWTVRNYLRFHELILVSDEVGGVFFDGNSDWANRVYEAGSRPDVQPLILGMHHDKMRRLSALGPEVFASPSRRSFALVRMALEDRRRDPAGTLRLYARKLWHWIRPYPTPFWGAPIVVGLGILYTVLYMLTAAGFSAAERRGAVRFAIAVLAISMGVHVLLLVLWRYRTPYWDPILLLWGVFAAGDRLERLWKR